MNKKIKKGANHLLKLCVSEDEPAGNQMVLIVGAVGGLIVLVLVVGVVLVDRKKYGECQLLQLIKT